MYAIIKKGSKQYRVAKGDFIDVDLLPHENNAQVEFEDVLFLNNGETSIVGTPNITGCVVKGILVQNIQGPKVIAFKYKRRKNNHRKVGHRAQYSRIKIEEIKYVT